MSISKSSSFKMELMKPSVVWFSSDDVFYSHTHTQKKPQQLNETSQFKIFALCLDCLLSGCPSHFAAVQMCQVYKQMPNTAQKKPKQIDES